MKTLQNRAWRLALGAFLGSALLTGCGGSSSGSDNDGDDERPANVRETQQGLVEGVEESYGLAFRGIPYAQPPVGDLRYADPVPAEPWDDTLMADEFGGSCIQPASTFGASESTEDCLYLNVYTPEDAEDRPVMVWIHGGSFETGSGGGSYTPSGLLEHDVVVVTVNYSCPTRTWTAPPAVTASWTSNWPCSGSRTTSPTSVVIRAMSPFSVSPPAGPAC